MDKFDITKAYASRSDVLAGKAPKEHIEENKSKDEKIKRKKK